MTLRPFRFSAMLILAGAALVAPLAFAENERADAETESQPQEAQPMQPASKAPAAEPPATEENPATMAPMVTRVFPESGTVTTQVTITGSNLSGVTKVMFAGPRNADFKIISDTEIQVTVPSGALQGPIELETSAGMTKTPVSFLVAYQ